MWRKEPGESRLRLFGKLRAGSLPRVASASGLADAGEVGSCECGTLKHQVLHILGTARSEASAIARIVASLARRIDPQRYTHHAWFLDGEGPLVEELADAGVEVRVLQWSRDLRDPVGAWHFVTGLRRERYSIVHQHTGGRLVSYLARGATGAAIVVHLHSTMAELVSAMRGVSVLEACNLTPPALRFPHADAIIAVSHATARFVSGCRPRVIHTGIPVNDTGCRRDEAAPRAEGCVIGAAGRLVPVKGTVYMVRAFSLLHADFPALRLEIAGSGPEQAAIEREARSLSIQDSVIFLGWQKDLARHLARWHIFVHPSLDESYGVAVLEAMAAGLPVVASAVGGVPELIDEGRTGWLVAPADPQALADRLRMLILDPPLRRAMGAAGRARVAQHFSEQQMAAAVTRVYDEVLAARGIAQ